MTPGQSLRPPDTAVDDREAEIRLLERIQDRLLWLSMNIIHHANHERPNPEKMKIGGHPASCASAVTILTALYFSFMKASDRIAVKPHASPVMHAAMYLLGVLPRERLSMLRQYGGLQAYPSRTKDPDAVDFSTGSVGLGAVAPTFAALTERYAHAHFCDTTASRFIAVSGDAELDEGNVWEAIIDESLQNLSNSLWVIDLNRQSLDRVVPGVRAGRLKALFADSGWQVIEAKYGARLQETFSRDGGAALRQCIDEMRNEEYQSLIRQEGSAIRDALVRRSRGSEIAASLSGTGRRRAARPSRQSRRARPARAAACIPERRAGTRAADGDLRLYDQGMAAAHGRGSLQPFGASQPGPAGGAARITRGRCRGPVGRLFPRQ